MIQILYGTDSFFHPQYGDDSFCKTLTSTKKELKRILKEDVKRGEETKETEKEVIKEFEKRVFDKKTCFSVGVLNISIGDLHILVKEINLV